MFVTPNTENFAVVLTQRAMGMRLMKHPDPLSTEAYFVTGMLVWRNEAFCRQKRAIMLYNLYVCLKMAALRWLP